MTEFLLKLKSNTALIGAILAAIVYFVPEVKPIACGMGFALPSLLQK